MAAFDYVAVDAGGRTVSGTLTADDDGAARALLARRKLMPLEVATSRGAAPVRTAASVGKGGGKLNARTLALVTRQLATLVTVSPVEEALRAIALQADRPAVRAVLEGVTSVDEAVRVTRQETAEAHDEPVLAVAAAAASGREDAA